MSDEERQRRVALFTPTLERLVALIRGRVRFHENFDSWHRDERSDFKRARWGADGTAGLACGVFRGQLSLGWNGSAAVLCGAAGLAAQATHAPPRLHPPPVCRVAVGDTLIDCASVLGGGRMLQLLVEPLLELSKQVTSGGQFDWRTAEAALYCIRAVHRCAPLPGDGLMMSLFGSLPMLPAVAQLQYTVALAVGAYADWLADTARRSEEGRTLLSQVGPGCAGVCGVGGRGSRGKRSVAARSPRAGLLSLRHCGSCPTDLPLRFTPRGPHPSPLQLLTMLTRFLSEPEASSASALSIRRLCDGCAPLLAGGGSMDALMGLYRQVQASGDVAQNRTELDLDEDDVQQVGCGVCVCLGGAEQQSGVGRGLHAMLGGA